jgi:hypothetical protein
MTIYKIAFLCVAAGALATGISSCSDSKTYAELLSDENMYVNNFLADHRVINSIPEDTVFVSAQDYIDQGYSSEEALLLAPYYRLDEDGMLYMQVVDPGTPDNKATYNQLIYFRYTRYNLAGYSDGEFASSAGNDDVLNGDAYFRYGNFEIGTSYSYGTGVQMPLAYLPIDSKVNIVIKSQYGAPDEMSYVIPYLYNMRYFKPKI